MTKYYWDNGIRVNVSRGTLESSMSRFYKHGSRNDFDFTNVDRAAEFAIKKEREDMELDKSLGKLRDLFKE